MFKQLVFCLLFLTLSLAVWALQPDFAADPAISPDGTQVCFVYQSDLWLVDFNGGNASRLTATEAGEWGPCWSPDGRWIAFNSNREGVSYPYLINPVDGTSTLIIAESFSVSDWFADGNSLLCTKYSQTFGSSFYKVPVSGSRPELLAEIGDRYASLAPDNKSIVFNRRGDPYREAYRGSVAGELWKLDIASKTYSRLTNTAFTERYPRFSHTQNALYYCAADGERFQLYRADKLDFANPLKLTNLADWSARDISVARQNDRIVFEYFNELWTYDPDRPANDRAAKLNVLIPEDIWQQNTRRDRMSNEFDSFAISPDELLVGFKYKYDTFLMPRKGGEVKQVTFDQASTGDMEFLDDNRTLLMTLMDKGTDKLYTAKCDSTQTAITPLEWFGKDSLSVEGFAKDASGKWVIYYGDKRLSGRIAVADKDLANIRALNVNRPVVTNFAISTNGDYAVYATTREDVWMRELWLYDFTRDEHRRIMNDDAWIRNISWTKDDRSLLLSRSNGIYRLDLVPRDEFEYEVDNWQEIFSKPAADSIRVIKADKALEIKLDEQDSADTLKAKPEPKVHKDLQVVWEGVEKRLYPVLTEDGVYLSVQQVIDDSTFYYFSEKRGPDAATELKKANIYGKSSKKEFDLGTGIGARTWIGKTLYYVKDGKILYYNTDKGSKGEVKAEFDYKYDTNLLNTRVFEQVWGKFGLNFYDPNMHGKNWQNLYQRYHPYAEKARSIDDIAIIVNEMIGEVNASHTGFYPRRDKNENYLQAAYLGLELDYSKALKEGIRIDVVYPGSRLANFYKVQAGDILTRIDGIAITAKTPVDSLLLDKAGKRIRVQYSSDGTLREAVVTGLSWAENRKLFYNHQVSVSKATVEKESNGRLGYVHIPAMGGQDYDNFYRDTFRDNADKEALIIDVRGNSGGHIHDQIITLLSKKPYALSTSRRYSQERITEPRQAWTKPTIVLVDEGSFSDGEIFPAVYQELKLGKLVGTPSSGSVIGTWEYDLLDGSSMRLPGSGWYKLDGTNMEGNGVVPDIIVEISPEDEIAGRDTQLLRAIEEILRDIK